MFKAIHGTNQEPEELYTSLSEYHDYEPSLEFDDSELLQNAGLGKMLSMCIESYFTDNRNCDSTHTINPCFIISVT